MFWAALFSTAVAFSLIWAFMSQSWMNAAAFIQAETSQIQSYKASQKTNQSLAELLVL